MEKKITLYHGTIFQFDAIYGDINSDEAVNILIRMMEPKIFPVQYLFSSQKAADLLI